MSRRKKGDDEQKPDDETTEAQTETTSDEPPPQSAGGRVALVDVPEEQTGKPAVIHSAPHQPGAPHAPGEEAEDLPAGTDNAQILYGLRKQGRLYRCTHARLPNVLVEADSAEQAKEAAATEFERLANEVPEAERPAFKAAAVGCVRLGP